MDTSDSENFESCDEDHVDFKANMQAVGSKLPPTDLPSPVNDNQATDNEKIIQDPAVDGHKNKRAITDFTSNIDGKPIVKNLSKETDLEKKDENKESDSNINTDLADQEISDIYDKENKVAGSLNNSELNTSFLNNTGDEMLKISDELEGWDNWDETETEKISHTVGGNVKHRVSRTANDLEIDRNLNLQIGDAKSDDWDAMWGESHDDLLNEYKEIQPQNVSRLKNLEPAKTSTSSAPKDPFDWGDEQTTEWTNDEKWMVNPSCPSKNDEKDEKVDHGWDNYQKQKPSNPENVAPLLDKLSLNNDESKGWSNWGNWGVSNLLSSATEGVQTLTNTVSQGFTTVLETSIGAPSPEEWATFQKKASVDAKMEGNKNPDEEVQSSKDTPKIDNENMFDFGNLLTGVTKLVETTSSKVVHTGLDTLETIGKKTMEVLQEGDPGLAKKRAFLGLAPEKPVLSQMLREAKEKAEQEDKEIEIKNQKRKVHFETLFDDHHGLVHLEALEMLSKQCEMKLETILEQATDKDLEKDLQETILQVKELCELPDEEEELEYETIKENINASVVELGVSVSFEKLFTLWTDCLETKLVELNQADTIHELAIDTLARMTAIIVEQFHKIAELLMIKERRSTADEADSLVQLTTVFISLVDVVAAKYSEKLNSLSNSPNKNDLNGLITNVFFEATNSSSYIQDAFQLLIPILQIGAV